MIRHLLHHEIDKQAWDARLSRCAVPWWYGRSWVLDAAAPGWEALVDEATGAQMALPWRKRFGIAYLHQPFLLQRIGVFGGDPQAFLAAVPKRFRYADIYLNAGEMGSSDHAVRISEQQNFELDLNAGMDALRKGYSENMRRNLKKAAGTGLTYEPNAEVEEVLAFLIGSEQFKRWGVDARRIECMERLLRGAQVRGEGFAVSIRAGSELVSCAYFVKAGGRLIFLKGLANEQGRALRAMPLLIDRVIEAHSGAPLILDFAGSNDEDLARFYRGFGAQRAVYLRSVINRLPPLVRNLKP
ncbi:MAG: GNAT family N-acetyltransferase [Flavobacteriales bacterium]|nr:GNAT family N-acetyltransferase [Flavobacteriales bacterium]